MTISIYYHGSPTSLSIIQVHANDTTRSPVMKSVYIAVTVIFLEMCYTSTVLSQCIQKYSDLEQSIFSKDSNIEQLRRAFYPVNKDPSNAVEVLYHFDDGSLPQPYRFLWYSSRVFGLLRPKVLQDLSFHVYTADVPVVDITLTPICGNISIHSMLINWERICSDADEASDALKLLNEMAANVSTRNEL